MFSIQISEFEETGDAVIRMFAYKDPDFIDIKYKSAFQYFSEISEKIIAFECLVERNHFTNPHISYTINKQGMINMRNYLNYVNYVLKQIDNKEIDDV